MKASLIRLNVLGTIALLALVVAGCSTRSVQGESLTQNKPISPAIVVTTEQARMVNVEVKVDSDKQFSEEGNTQATGTEQDGPALLQLHCERCHRLTTLEKTPRSRSDWERILSRMERTGVRLTEAEKSALLEYLAIPDNQ